MINHCKFTGDNLTYRKSSLLASIAMRLDDIDEHTHRFAAKLAEDPLATMREDGETTIRYNVERRALTAMRDTIAISPGLSASELNSKLADLLQGELLNVTTRGHSSNPVSNMIAREEAHVIGGILRAYAA